MTRYKPKHLQADEARAAVNLILNGYPEDAERKLQGMAEDDLRDLHQLGSIIREGTERELYEREDRARRLLRKGSGGK
jgi:hypothetical protein